ncbi:MAG: hypothetical protein ACR5LD_00325 [Symbiopectobacterium sp.]
MGRRQRSHPQTFITAYCTIYVNHDKRVGEYEEKPSKADSNQPVDPKHAKRQARHSMVTKARDLVTQLHSENHAASFILFEGKHHGSLIPDAISKSVEVNIQLQ